MINHITDALIDASNSLKLASNPTHQCVVSSCLMKSAPDTISETVSELLFGESLELVSRVDDWAQIVSSVDNYVGWVPVAAIADIQYACTHAVSAPSTHLYERPDLKSRPIIQLSMGSELNVDVAAAENRFLKTSTGWVFNKHVSAITDAAPDPVAIAERFIGTPYLWGGRTYTGLDCSALIQMPLKICCHRVPRDSSMQFKTLGHGLSEDEKPQYGDIAFFPGHVGWIVDEEHVLHANATHMAVTIDPLSDVIEWVAAETDKDPFLGFRRLAQGQ